MKTKLRLYDRWLADTFKRSDLKFREYLMTARLFEPDPEAIGYALDQSYGGPKEMENLIKLARLPFNHIWIEDDTKTRLTHGKERHHLAPVDLDNTFRVSFLLYRSSTSETRWHCHPLPDFSGSEYIGFVHEYTVDTEQYVKPELTDEELRTVFPALPANANEHLSALLLGYHRSPDLTPARRLLPHVGLSLPKKLNPEIAEAMWPVIKEMGGTLRYIITLLAAINLCETRFVPQPKKMDRIMVGRRSIPYLATTKVSIKIPNKPLHKLARAAVSGWHNRAHEVRGHWRKHLDRESGETILKWIKEQECRGDASLGWVRHQYHVEGRT